MLCPVEQVCHMPGMVPGIYRAGYPILLFPGQFSMTPRLGYSRAQDCESVTSCLMPYPKEQPYWGICWGFIHFYINYILNCHTLKQWGTSANELFLPESSIQHSSNKVIKLCWDVILFYKTLLAHSGIIKNQPPNQWVSLEICLFAWCYWFNLF